MERNWHDFKALYGNLPGARDAFETACESLFRRIYSEYPVSQVAVKKGDSGIDIFVGELGVSPIIVIQCKFFLEAFGDSQKDQIRGSFNTAINSKKFKIKEWILCIPTVFAVDDQSWWFEWRKKKIDEHKEKELSISLKNGNELIDLLKEKDLYNQVFRVTDAIKLDEIHKILIPPKIQILQDISPKNILFNSYHNQCEPYYLERRVDNEFKKSLILNNVWIYGDSGVGKTTLVNRNLTIDKNNYCYCDLSPVKILSSQDVLEEILCKIEEKFEVDRNNKERNVIKQITQLLRNIGKKVIIVIDELSVKETSTLKDIANDLVNMVIHFCNISGHKDLRFVVSTISSPKEIIENRSKATDHFQYLDCNNWSNKIEELFDLLSNSLQLNLNEHKAEIIKASRNSPRHLKAILRKIITVDNLSAETIQQIISLVESEVVN